MKEGERVTAVIYFSRAGENLIEGVSQNIIRGNTEVLAKKIAKKLSIPTFAIEPTLPYPIAYSETVARVKKEKEQQSRPEIKPISLDFQEEKKIFLGFPNWWGTFPMPVASFLASGLLDGKVIYPFCTHEGSAFGSSLEDLAKSCPTAEVKTGLSVRGSRVSKSDAAIKNWLQQYYCEKNKGKE